MYRSFVHFGMTIGLVLSVVPLLEGQDAIPVEVEPEWMGDMRRILEISGQQRKTQQEKADAYKELATLKPKIDDDPRLVFSFALAAMAEEQWPSAEKLSSELSERQPDYIPARVAHTRLLLKSNKLLPALAELEALAKELRSPSPAVTQEQLTVAASFLGLSVGYFEGPASELIKPTALKLLITAADSIPETLKEPYSQSRAVVTEEYQVLVESGEDALKKLRDNLSKDTEQMRAELESKRAKTLEDAETAKRNLQETFAQTKSTWDAAMAQCRSLSQTAAGMQLKQAQIAQNLGLLQPPRADKDGKVDYNDQRRFDNERRRLQNSLDNLELQLNNMSLQYNSCVQRGMLAENQMNALRMQSKKLGMELASQDSSFAKMERMIKGKEKSAQKAKPPMTGAKLQRARAFTTYDDFNYFKERAMLIDSLAN